MSITTFSGRTSASLEGFLILGFPAVAEVEEEDAFEDFSLASSASKAGARDLTTASRSEGFAKDCAAVAPRSFLARFSALLALFCRFLLVGDRLSSFLLRGDSLSRLLLGDDHLSWLLLGDNRLSSLLHGEDIWSSLLGDHFLSELLDRDR